MDSRTRGEGRKVKIVARRGRSRRGRERRERRKGDRDQSGGREKDLKRNEHGEEADDGKGIVQWIKQSVRIEVEAGGGVVRKRKWETRMNEQ
jgi:hypothetical protein